MFRSLQNRFTKRLENLKEKTQTQTDLEKIIRSFLISEFGPIGEALVFRVSEENKKLYIKLENKTAANEVVLRSGKLREILKSQKRNIQTLTID
jgi:hypothetical protein